MATMTYYVALAFKRSEDGGEIVACVLISTESPFENAYS